MSLKLSAGCGCCGCAVCAASQPSEFDATLYGFSNHSSGDCTGCANLDDVYTLKNEITPTYPYDCSWKYESFEHSGGHYATCDTDTEVFIQEVVLGLERQVLTIVNTVFIWELTIKTNFGGVHPYGEWFNSYGVWESGQPLTTSCYLNYLFFNLEPSASNVDFCIATDGTTTADVEPS
tara:strand:+ start:1671 stop:2204 length:534 start_codon:yes stop_codon:yes gene_type:complete